MVQMTLEDPTTLAQRLEAILMTADRPMSDARLLDILELAPADEEDDGPSPRARLHEAIEALNADYAASARSFRVNKVAGGWQMLTLPAFTGDITRLKGARQLAKLSSAALETLAIIAYKQPILRTDIESIRGVACGEMLRSLDGTPACQDRWTSRGGRSARCSMAQAASSWKSSDSRRWATCRKPNRSPAFPIPFRHRATSTARSGPSHLKTVPIERDRCGPLR